MNRREAEQEAWLDRQYALETMAIADPEYWRAIVSQPEPVTDDERFDQFAHDIMSALITNLQRSANRLCFDCDLPMAGHDHSQCPINMGQSAPAADGEPVEHFPTVEPS